VFAETCEYPNDYACRKGVGLILLQWDKAKAKTNLTRKFTNYLFRKREKEEANCNLEDVDDSDDSDDADVEDTEDITDDLGTRHTEGRTRTDDFKACIKAKVAFREHYEDEAKKRRELIMKVDPEISIMGAHQLALTQLWSEEQNHWKWVECTKNTLTTSSDDMYE
jgi:hypothetical protein